MIYLLNEINFSTILSHNELPVKYKIFNENL